MVDPARPRASPDEPQGPLVEAPPTAPQPGAPVAADTAPPHEPAQPPAYALPTARRVVSSGLQLALASTTELRTASIYVGLLVLGSFGPAIIALLLILGRLGDGAGEAIGSLLFGQGQLALVQPALEAALLVVAIELLVGLLLFVAISIDAQVIGIAILAGRATGRPLRLWEAVTRARQTYWRMAGAGAVVGIAGAVVQALITGAIGGLSRSDEATNVIAGLVAAIVVSPLAYVSAGIVLGDVAAMESLSRSWRLFRARRALALVVVLFSFVASAIHLFALGAGVDLMARAADLLHVSLSEGVAQFLVATVLILATVVAYGSLTFTIGAVVSAPQVTGFLGLTFYSAGLDRARSDLPRPPRGFHYVTRPMAVALIGLAGVVALEIPAINSIPLPPPSAAVDLVRALAAEQPGADLLDVYGRPTVVDDVEGDGGAGALSDVDLVAAEFAYLDTVPGWLLDRFDCARADTACDEAAGAFDGGALLFVHRLAAPLPQEAPRRVAVLLKLGPDTNVSDRNGAGSFRGASLAIVTTTGVAPQIAGLQSRGFEMKDVGTASRSTWTGNVVYTLMPAVDLPRPPSGWDMVVLAGEPPDAASARDGLRSNWTGGLPALDLGGVIFIDDYRDPD